MLIISIILNTFLSWENVWLRFGSKILMLPLIVGVGYEFIRFAGAHDNIFTRIVSAPGKWMQLITTREPSDEQLEVALAALRNAIPEEFGGIVQDGGILAEDGTTTQGQTDAASASDDGKTEA